MERNVIGKNTTIIGEIISEGDFRIDGYLDGKLQTKGKVIIGAEGKVEGSIEAQNADIEGKFTGNLRVFKTLSLKAVANITGEVVVGKLSVEPGAIFNASCEMKAEKKEVIQLDDKKTENRKTDKEPKRAKKFFK